MTARKIVNIGLANKRKNAKLKKMYEADPRHVNIERLSNGVWVPCLYPTWEPEYLYRLAECRQVTKDLENSSTDDENTYTVPCYIKARMETVDGKDKIVLEGSSKEEPYNVKLVFSKITGQLLTVGS